MSVKIGVENLPRKVLIDADVIIGYLTSDSMSENSERVIDVADQARVKLQASSEIYDDIITALRTSEVSMNRVIDVLTDVGKIPFDPLPITSDIVMEAMVLYSRFGGSRKLHYFDSFHAATARIHELPIITSDRFILHNSRHLGITALDLLKV